MCVFELRSFILQRNFCWSCEVQCAHPCWWDTALQKRLLLLLLLLSVLTHYFFLPSERSVGSKDEAGGSDGSSGPVDWGPEQEAGDGQAGVPHADEETPEPAAQTEHGGGMYVSWRSCNVLWRSCKVSGQSVEKQQAGVAEPAAQTEHRGVYVSSTVWYHWWELSQVSFLLWQNFCRYKHDKTCLFLWQKYACCDKLTFATNTFVATHVLLQQKFCHCKCTFVATKDVFCHDKSMLVTTKLLSQQKWYLRQLPPTIVWRSCKVSGQSVEKKQACVAEPAAWTEHRELLTSSKPWKAVKTWIAGVFESWRENNLPFFRPQKLKVCENWIMQLKFFRVWGKIICFLKLSAF